MRILSFSCLSMFLIVLLCGWINNNLCSICQCLLRFSQPMWRIWNSKQKKIAVISINVIYQCLMQFYFNNICKWDLLPHACPTIFSQYSRVQKKRDQMSTTRSHIKCDSSVTTNASRLVYQLIYCEMLLTDFNAFCWPWILTISAKTLIKR